MAIDYSGYAQSYAGNPGAYAQLGQGLGQVMQAIGQNRQAQVGQSYDDIITNLITGGEKGLGTNYLNMLETNPGDWASLGPQQSSAKAYLDWKKGLSKGERRMAQQQGLLNPIAFKQLYDQQMAPIASGIAGKLLDYQATSHKTDDEMKEWMEERGFDDFMRSNVTDPSNPYYTQMRDLITPDETWKQWWQNKGIGEKAGIGIGLGAAGPIGVSSARDIAKRGFNQRYNPFAAKQSIARLNPKMAQEIGKDLGFAQSKSYQKSALKGGRTAQSNATRVFNQAKKLYGGKKVVFEKTAKGAKLLKAKDAAKIANIAIKKGVEQGPARGVGAFVKKHGMSGLIKKVIQKTGYKGAMKLLGKGALSLGLKGTGVGAAASLLLDASTIYTLYAIISDMNE